MISNLPKWPEKWEQHLINYCSLYFCDKEIEFLNKDYLTIISTNNSSKGIEVSCINFQFKIGDYAYMADFKLDNSMLYECIIFYKHTALNDKVFKATDSYSFCTDDIVYLNNICGIMMFNATCDTLVKYAEKEILFDYKQRSKWDNDNGDDDTEEDAPISPFSPSTNEPVLMY